MSHTTSVYAFDDSTTSSTLGPRAAREDVVLCVRCGRPTGRNLNIKLCDACDHDLDACYQQWVEEQARRADEGRA
jgi:ribosomal protein L37E